MRSAWFDKDKLYEAAAGYYNSWKKAESRVKSDKELGSTKSSNSDDDEEWLSVEYNDEVTSIATSRPLPFDVYRTFWEVEGTGQMSDLSSNLTGLHDLPITRRTLDDDPSAEIPLEGIDEIYRKTKKEEEMLRRALEEFTDTESSSDEDDEIPSLVPLRPSTSADEEASYFEIEMCINGDQDKVLTTPNRLDYMLVVGDSEEYVDQEEPTDQEEDECSAEETKEDIIEVDCLSSGGENWRNKNTTICKRRMRHDTFESHYEQSKEDVIEFALLEANCTKMKHSKPSDQKQIHQGGLDDALTSSLSSEDYKSILSAADTVLIQVVSPDSNHDQGLHDDDKTVVTESVASSEFYWESDKEHDENNLLVINDGLDDDDDDDQSRESASSTPDNDAGYIYPEDTIRYWSESESEDGGAIIPAETLSDQHRRLSGSEILSVISDTLREEDPRFPAAASTPRQTFSAYKKQKAPESYRANRRYSTVQFEDEENQHFIIESNDDAQKLFSTDFESFDSFDEVGAETTDELCDESHIAEAVALLTPLEAELPSTEVTPLLNIDDLYSDFLTVDDDAIAFSDAGESFGEDGSFRTDDEIEILSGRSQLETNEADTIVPPQVPKMILSDISYAPPHHSSFRSSSPITEDLLQDGQTADINPSARHDSERKSSPPKPLLTKRDKLEWLRNRFAEPVIDVQWHGGSGFGSTTGAWVSVDNGRYRNRVSLEGKENSIPSPNRRRI